RELGIAVTAYGVLSRGLLGGTGAPAGAGDFRAHSPRWQGENLKRNLALAEALQVLAREKNVAPAALAIAWVLSRGSDIVPLVGARKRPQLQASLASVRLALSAEDLARIERAVPETAVAGARYDARQMAMLDSEKESQS